MRVTYKGHVRAAHTPTTPARLCVFFIDVTQRHSISDVEDVSGEADV